MSEIITNNLDTNNASDNRLSLQETQKINKIDKKELESQKEAIGSYKLPWLDVSVAALAQAIWSKTKQCAAMWVAMNISQESYTVWDKIINGTKLSVPWSGSEAIMRLQSYLVAHGQNINYQWSYINGAWWLWIDGRFGWAVCRWLAEITKSINNTKIEVKTKTNENETSNLTANNPSQKKIETTTGDNSQTRGLGPNNTINTEKNEAEKNKIETINKLKQRITEIEKKQQISAAEAKEYVDAVDWINSNIDNIDQEITIKNLSITSLDASTAQELFKMGDCVMLREYESYEANYSRLDLDKITSIDIDALIILAWWPKDAKGKTQNLRTTIHLDNLKNITNLTPEKVKTLKDILSAEKSSSYNGSLHIPDGILEQQTAKKEHNTEQVVSKELSTAEKYGDKEKKELTADEIKALIQKHKNNSKKTDLDLSDYDLTPDAAKELVTYIITSKWQVDVGRKYGYLRDYDKKNMPSKIKAIYTILDTYLVRNDICHKWADTQYRTYDIKKLINIAPTINETKTKEISNKQKITKEEAMQLVRSNYHISLNITEISADVAEVLSCCRWKLTLNKIKTITPDAATSLGVKSTYKNDKFNWIEMNALKNTSTIPPELKKKLEYSNLSKQYQETIRNTRNNILNIYKKTPDQVWMVYWSYNIFKQMVTADSINTTSDSTRWYLDRAKQQWQTITSIEITSNTSGITQRFLLPTVWNQYERKQPIIQTRRYWSASIEETYVNGEYSKYELEDIDPNYINLIMWFYKGLQNEAKKKNVTL